MKKNNYKGFTLLEMMVALMIFSLIGLAGVQLIRGGLKNREQMREKSADFTQIQRTFTRFEQDFGQAVVRKKLRKVTKELPVEMSGKQHSDHISEVTLLRGNKFNPGGYLPRSSLEWVKWHVVDGKLMRGHAALTDNGEEAQQFTNEVLLDDVSAFHVTFADKRGWHENWSAQDTLPEAVAVSLVTAGSGALQRVVLVPGQG
ncbi:type II secretion system minor pseudopilin GspJ [Erwinia psidii]|uniref:Type II secretion system protein J n=1 Tax=Erwinia psidii TaxID=69224 RepID=A0A3N6RVS6_9GAMM|nr:type II secretion system minor pseudopilin GspJ [Erwinia psidii]MCX8958084.1 type II secretion system protein GspJ [Erwinia psidii]MCX8962484.1 type II secretion system protein GspJ [Erwinia psidii]RQM37064.1 type II secretion system protein GspJ [Erwinia psidii]